MTVADQIRALATQGLSRAEIARRLGKSYQHVRNVLEGDRSRDAGGSQPNYALGPAPSAPSGFGEPPATFGRTYRLDVEEGGVVRLPPAVLAALQTGAGGVLIGDLEEDRLVVLSARAAWRRIDERMAPFRRPGGPLASEELIAERRAEAQRESDG